MSHPRPQSPPATDLRGVGLILVSAASFAVMALLAKDAYAHGAGVIDLLTWRFALAALTLWAIAAARGSLTATRVDPALRRRVVQAVALGLGLYAAETGLVYAALTRLDASLTSLLLYTYPALVFGGAVLLGRERVDARRSAALLSSTAGAMLVLLGAGGGIGALDGLGVGLALASAAAYAAYVLTVERTGADLDPFVLGASVCTGAGLSFLTAAAVTGTSLLAPSAHVALDAVTLATVSTVLPMVTLYLGMRRIGATTASIVSSAEPVLTVGLALALFGESLGPVQALGGVLVMAAVGLVQYRGRGPRLGRGRLGGHGAPAHPAGPAAARAFEDRLAHGWRLGL